MQRKHSSYTYNAVNTVQPIAWRLAFGVVAIVAIQATLVRPVFAQKGEPSYVIVAEVIKKTLAEGRTYIATVEPSRRATIGSAIDGRVDDFLVNEGDRVKAGDTLAQLKIETISKEVEAAEAQKELLQSELKELENGSRPQEIQQAKFNMEAKEAASEFLESRVKRLTELRERSVTTAEELQEVVTAALAARKALAESTASFELVKEGPRKERLTQKKAEITGQEAIIQKLKDQKRKHTIITRFDGYVTKEFTELGAWANRGDPIATVVALDKVHLVASVVEDDIAHLELGMSALVKIGALKNQLWPGTVKIIVPEADPRSRTFPVKIKVDNQIVKGQPVIKAGMLAQVTLPAGDQKQATLVPKDALVLGGRNTNVWVVDSSSVKPDGNFNQANVKQITVKIGIADGEYIEVIGDIKPGDLVVTEGNERIFAPIVKWNPKEVVKPKPKSNLTSKGKQPTPKTTVTP